MQREHVSPQIRKKKRIAKKLCFTIKINQCYFFFNLVVVTTAAEL